MHAEKAIKEMNKVTIGGRVLYIGYILYMICNYKTDKKVEISERIGLHQSEFHKQLSAIQKLLQKHLPNIIRLYMWVELREGE